MRNRGTTDPDDSSTFPNRTMQKRVSGCPSCIACKMSSAKRFVAPITLVGLTALSLDIRTKFSTPTATSLCVGTAIIGELLQISTAGDASVVDLANDGAGIAVALLLITFLDKDLLPGLKRKSRFVVLAAGLLIMGTAFHPAVSISHALVARANALPELISFDHGWERVLYRSYGGAAVIRIPLGDDGSLVAVVSMGRAQYSGLVIEPYPDWRGYTALRFSILTLGHTPRRVTLRIDDVSHSGQYSDRFNRTFEIDSSVSEFVVPLSEISALENGRRLRLDAVRSMIFFMVNTDGSEKIIIDDIRLLTN